MNEEDNSPKSRELAPSKPESQQRLTRERNYSGQEVLGQIREIAKLISKGKWVLGVTEHQKAEKWGLAIPTIRARAAEARRLVQESFGDLSDIRADVMAQLAGIAQETRRKEPRTAVSALQTIAAVTGLIVTHRINHEVKRALSPEQRKAEIQRIRAQLDLAEREIDEEPETIDVPGVPEDDGT